MASHHDCCTEDHAGRRITIILRALVWTGLIIGTSPSVNAQPDAPLLLKRIDEPIHLDGIMDEGAWSSVPALPLIMYEPIGGGTMTERTEIRVAYDARHIYIGAHLFANDPKTVRADSYERDDWTSEGDFLNVVLDTFNDNENGVSFSTTPSGIRLDSEITNDAEGEWLNTNWDAVWDAVAVLRKDGWSAEMRIPFSSLRFRQVGGEVHMGLTINRFIADRNERHIFPAIEPSAASALWKPSLYKDVVFVDVAQADPVYISPYTLLKGYAPSRDGVTAAKPTFGADLQYGLTSGLTLDVTINPDFAQVESDDEQINLTRFPLFYPEKRRFFQERSGLFAYDLGSNGHLFHSRRVGLTEDGRPLNLLGGLRLTGRVAGWEVALMNIQASPSEHEAENYGVVRIRRQIANPYSYVGAMATTKIDGAGSVSMAHGVDGRVRIIRDEYVSFSGTHTAASGGGQFPRMSAGRLYLGWERRTDVGLAYTSRLVYSGPDFDPHIGFSERSAFAMADQTISYGWFASKASTIRFHLPRFQSTVFVRTSDGSLESAVQKASWNVDLKAGGAGAVAIQRRQEDVRERFHLRPHVWIPTGAYTFVDANASYAMPATRRTGGRIRADVGSFYDGHRVAVLLESFAVISPHLRLRLSVERNWLRFPVRNQRMDALIGRLKVRAALNTRLSAFAAVQYNRLDDSLRATLRVRFNAREGNDLYVVVHSMPDDLSLPASLSSASSTRNILMLKYTHTMRY